MIWDASSGECLQTLECHSSFFRSLAFSPDSARLASASGDSTVRIWDANSGKCVHTLEGHSSEVSSVAFSHDSAQLASASHDKTVRIWDASSGKCVHTLEGHSSEVSSVAFSHDSSRLASASWDRTVKIWNAGSGKCLQALEVRRVLCNISFDTTGICLQTEIGVIALDASLLSTISKDKISQAPQYTKGGLSSDRAWITYDSKNILWLPPEYRPSCYAVSANTVALGVGSGKVWMCSFNYKE
jgi:WD40 repeat protein